jgi:hypothetical protein
MDPYRRFREPAEYDVFLRRPSGALSRVRVGHAHAIGRDPGCDIALRDDARVLERHATVAVDGAGLSVRPLAVTPTFVDDVAVTTVCFAREGARIRVGDTTLTVVRGPSVEAEYAAQQHKMRECIVPRRFSGNIADVPVADLLVLLSVEERSGVLVVRTEQDDVGKIFLRRGAIDHASINFIDEIPPMKAIFRMLLWREGLYELDAPEAVTHPQRDLSVPMILEELGAQIEAFQAIRNELPDLDAHLVVMRPLAPRPPELTVHELAILRLFEEHGRLEVVLNASPLSDLDTVRTILDLIERAYLGQQ